jgi:hypothetical protein
LKGLVGDGMDMHSRIDGFPGEFAHHLAQLPLEVVGEVILSAEEDNTALRYCHRCELLIKVRSEMYIYQ